MRQRDQRRIGRRVARVALGILLVAVVVAGCGRRKFEPLKEDSTAVARVDSFAVRIRDVQGQWERGDGENASRTTANVLLADLRARSAANPSLDWAKRAHELLDSLGVGAELEGSGGALVANFFSRSDPSLGSWPWLFSRNRKTIDGQAVEGRDLRLLDVSAVGLGAADTARAPGVAALFQKRGAMGYQPIMYAWRRGADARWQIQATLGPDSLGGYGTAELLRADTTIDVVARTYRPVRGFEECATCPHVFRVVRIRWSPLGFSRLEDRMVPSPYSTFVRFVLALQINDRELAESLVTDRQWIEQARRLGFDTSRLPWRVAPATDETAREMVFIRGKSEAYRILFAPANGDWRVDGIAATTVGME